MTTPDDDHDEDQGGKHDHLALWFLAIFTAAMAAAFLVSFFMQEAK
jgi:hypothetical protein